MTESIRQEMEAVRAAFRRELAEYRHCFAACVPDPDELPDEGFFPMLLLWVAKSAGRELQAAVPGAVSVALLGLAQQIHRGVRDELPAAALKYPVLLGDLVLGKLFAWSEMHGLGHWLPDFSDLIARSNEACSRLWQKQRDAADAAAERAALAQVEYGGMARLAVRIGAEQGRMPESARQEMEDFAAHLGMAYAWHLAEDRPALGEEIATLHARMPFLSEVGAAVLQGFCQTAHPQLL